MKKILILLTLFLLTGCYNKPKVETIVETNSESIVAINYPVSNYKKLDKQITNYIDKIYKQFKQEYTADLAELNIDYKYETINDNYINVFLTTFINTNNLAHPVNYINTFVYSIKDKKILSLQDIMNKEELKKLSKMVQTELLEKYKDCVLMKEMLNKINDIKLFTFDSDNLTIYFNPYEVTAGYCNIIEIKIPISKLNLKIKLTKDVINIVKADQISKDNVIDPSKPLVALTFDDGPSKYTRKIVELLDKYNSNATFFVLGNKVKLYSDDLNYVIKQGNEIGNHSYNHKWLTRLSAEELENQISKTQKIIKEYTGYTPTLLRPTYGSINSKLKKNVNMEIVLWSVDSLDWKIKDSNKIADRVMSQVEDGDIVLFHDTYKRTYDALEIIVPKLIEQGYQIVTVSELKAAISLRNHN